MNSRACMQRGIETSKCSVCLKSGPKTEQPPGEDKKIPVKKISRQTRFLKPKSVGNVPSDFSIF